MAWRRRRLRGAGLLNRIAALAVVATSCAVASVPTTEPAGVAPAGALVDEHASARSALLVAINSDRAAAGTPPLAFDSLATAVAQAHAAVMVGEGFFSHYTPRGEAPYERYAIAGGLAHLRENVFQWRISGGIAEDVVTARRNLQIARVHELLMESPGHRATILDPHRTHVGIGMASDAEGRVFVVVEDFLARHATIELPRVAWRGSPTILRGQVFGRDARALLVVLEREPAVRDWVARGEPPPGGPYIEGGGGEVMLVPPWRIARSIHGAFELELPLHGASPGRFYGVLYVAPPRVIERAIARGRASTENGWPAAAFVIELL